MAKRRPSTPKRGQQNVALWRPKSSKKEPSNSSGLDKITKSLMNMSLSNLDPSPTNGSLSQVSSDGQNFFSEKQHPLLLPTVLDAVFPYLTLSEVKNSRFVCKPWGEVGIQFIGRRKLKPVKFSNVTHKDFLALIKEFEELRPKPHPKLKLFQGFRLTWEDVVTMAYCKFMPSFKPSQLYVSGNVINDPSASLRTLLQPIVATLRDLTIKIKWAIDIFPPSFLENLARLGMTLQRLHLQIFNEGKYVPLGPGMIIPSCVDGARLRQALNDLLANQSPFLEELSLDFNCYVGRNDNVNYENKIQFPIFPRLQSLSLAIQFNIDQGIRSLDNFQPFDFCLKFPNLFHLDLNYLVLSKMVSTLDLTKGHPLKKLNITSSSFNYSSIVSLDKLVVSFPHLEEFSNQHILPLWLEFPWMNTLRKLEIGGRSLQFNFLHLKKLEYLHYTLYKDVLFGDVNVDGLIIRLLDHYTQLPRLKKFHLSGLKVSPEQLIQIQEVLPTELRAILTIDVLD